MAGDVVTREMASEGRRALPIGARVVITRRCDYQGYTGTVTHNLAALSPRGAYGVYVRIEDIHDEHSYMFFEDELTIAPPSH